VSAAGSAPPAARTIGITGASGFLGRALAERFLRDGFAVVAYVRDPARALPTGAVPRPYELGAEPDLDGVDALVHCAYAARAALGAETVRRNVEGTLRLARAAAARGIRFVFVSSVNAAGAVRSAYAEQKRAIEAGLPAEALVLRPGLIVGEGGAFASLARIARLPAVPLVGGGRLVQVVTVEDVYGALRTALGANLSGVHGVVAEPPVPLRRLVAACARRGTPLLPVPFGLAYALAAAAERLGVRLPVTTENLRGLGGTRAHPPSAALTALGWRPRGAEAVLAELAEKAAR
jgi:nucleoside-diphosphate-sugar epimerase